MATESTESIPYSNGYVFVCGYGVKIRTSNNYLLIDDGICTNRRSAKFHAIAGLKRLVLQSTDGYITLDALDWLNKNRVGFLHLNDDGNVITTSHVGHAPKPLLRRAQALTAFNGTALPLARFLIGEKIRNQARTMHKRDCVAIAERIENLARSVEVCPSLNDVRVLESHAASLYFDSLANSPMTFNRKDSAKIPEHWRTFGKRYSDYSKCPRAATNPMNAMLNYLYAILEGETLIALYARGLDTGLGILHSDSASHTAFVFDIMEPLRPMIDALLLDFCQKHTFSKSDFFDSEHGIVRMTSALRRLLTESFYAHSIHSHIANTVDDVVAYLSSICVG